MKTHIDTFFKAPMARQTVVVPILIMFIFSVFTLTAPTDPARTVQAVRLGVVNKDTGLPMPPVKLSERMLGALGGQLPFMLAPYDSREAALADLEAGELSAFLVFPEAFSATAMAGPQAAFEIVASPAVTIAEFQVVQQLEQMLPAAMSAGVASMKLAMAEGRMPTGEMPVAATITTLGETPPMARLQAPFAMLYTTWLAALVGAVMMVIATRKRSDRGTVALIRTLVPVGVVGLASLGLSLVVGATAGWGSFLPAWGVVWPSALALTWLFIGLMSVLGLWLIALLLPLAFYQSAIGGVMAPAAAAPDWLATLTSWAGLDRLGAAYRAAVHGVGPAYPLALVAILALVGLALIWIKSAIPVRNAA